MHETGTYLAIFLGDKGGARMAQWLALPEAERRAKEREGMSAWRAWMRRHAEAVVAAGGPLGPTKRVDGSGVHDNANAMGAFTVVRAASPEEAAKLFEDHRASSSFPAKAWR